jgi:hypothetical protein
MACTLVTAYFPIKSKFPSSQYIEWASHFLQLEASIVLFTTPELAPFFKNIRGTKPLHIVETNFNDLYMWKTYKDQWIYHHTIDREAHHHTPELYAIWASKSVFVEEAIALNVFHTDHFFWCDFGAFRKPVSEIIRTTFPSTKWLPQHKILLNSIHSLVTEDKKRHADGIIGNFYHTDRIVGGLWGGDKSGCLRWRKAYETMLLNYFSVKRFAGKDQSVMLSAYLDDPTLITVVKPTISGNDWFFLQSLLSDLDVPFVRDPTYILSHTTA